MPALRKHGKSTPRKAVLTNGIDERKEIEVSRRIRQFNDALRTSLQGGKLVLTPSVKALSDATVSQALLKLRTFDKFTKDNDPFGEHEFGSFEFADQKFVWKIEAFDKELRYGSKDPADPNKTTRVVTLMLAKEP
jgi:hypothetical protein